MSTIQMYGVGGWLVAIVAFLGYTLVFVLSQAFTALACHVGVEIVSVGFGRRLLGFQFCGADWRLSLFPSGGYTQMASNALNGIDLLHPIGRMTIQAVGPFSNLVIGTLLIWGSGLAGSEAMPLIRMMGWLGLILGLFNLLPIPPLTGGQMFFSLYELLCGRPLPLDLRAKLSIIGYIATIVVFILGIRWLLRT